MDVSSFFIDVLTIFTLSLFFCSCSFEEGQKNFCGGVELSVSGRAEDDLYVKGSFNGWSLAAPMSYREGKWRVELFLEPGDYPYLFFSAKSGENFNDPENPLTMFDKGVRYSRLIVPDCRYPRLELLDRVNISGKRVDFKIKFFAGISGGSPDFKRSRILLNNEEADFSFDKKNGIISIDYTALKNGKLNWFFKIFDTDGFASETLTLPVWIEESPFSWEEATIYQIMTDRFSNGDLSNDDPSEGVEEKANWQGGDFQGIIDKIDENYFTDLGVNALWISSPIANAKKSGKGMGGDERYYSAYHSYWPIATGWSDDFKIPGLDSPIEKHFGTEAKLRELVQKAHEKGIRVIFDFVPNHVHTDSYLWQTYKNQNWFNMAADGLPPNKNGGYSCGWERPLDCWFTDYLPDFNYKNIDVSNRVIDHLIWLIQEFDVDGLRLDAIRLMEIDFTTTLKTMIQRRVTTTGILFYMIGETFTGDNGWEEIGYYIGEKKLDGQFDFPLYHHIVRTFLLQSETLVEFADFIDKNDYRYQNDYYKNAIMGNFIGNHDVARALSLANRDFDGVSSQGGEEANRKAWEDSPLLPEEELPFQKMRNALSFLFTHPGIPIIYQGDEFGTAGANDPDNRRMVVFGDDLSLFQAKNLAHTQIISAFRQKHSALRRGTRKKILVNEKIYAFFMSDEEDATLAIFNNSDSKATESIDVSSFGSVSELSALFSGKRLKVVEKRVEIELEPFSAELLFR